MGLNEIGQIDQQCWDSIPQHFPNVEIDQFGIMPNHLHGVIMIVEPILPSDRVEAQHAAPLPLTINVKPGSLGAIVRSFKSASTKRINEILHTPGASIWQPNYYEHVIRNEKELDQIREYILYNPLRWALDNENPANKE